MHVLVKLSTQIRRLDAVALTIGWQVLEGNAGRHVLDKEGLQCLRQPCHQENLFVVVSVNELIDEGLDVRLKMDYDTREEVGRHLVVEHIVMESNNGDSGNSSFE
jgi:hypothetical protein